ncbi:hypothetical protein [Terrabacter terrigena]|uniref:DUF4328 domain-containing protein n=1 Tax=Terrabacter terrigena TaxID=574718 RepID=A0ABW3N4U4_9MICO
MDDRGGDTTGAAAVVAVPDDRPVRARQPRLRRPAAWSLGLGISSLPPLVLGAASAPPSDGSYRVSTVLLLAAGVFACVWLVRLQWLVVRARHSPTLVPDLGMWVMWALPVVSWILPPVRISRLDKAIHGRRSWMVWAWGAGWAPLTMPSLWSPDRNVDIPVGDRAWLLAATAVVTFGLWTLTVVRLTRGAEVVAHVSGLDA